MHNKLIISSLFWKFMERIGLQGIQFIVQIILARILLPSDFGAIALIIIFINIANVFVQGGFNMALIQNNDVTEDDYSSVFILSILVAFMLYIILFISAPIISSFYNMSILVKIIRVLSITLFFGAFNSIQVAKLSREFAFKKMFTSSIGAYIISGFIAIILAYNGFGIWSIVVQQLLSQMSVSIIFLFIVSWRPKFIFNSEKVKKLFDFGSKMLLSNLLDTLYNNIYSLVIGKVFSPTQLGYYNRAEQFPQIIVLNINGSIQSVILPALSREQDNLENVKNLMKRAMLTSAYIVFPMMIGLSVCAKPLIQLVLTEEWLPAVPLMQLLCISYMFWPIHTANLQAINAMGRSDIFLKLEVIKKIIGISLLFFSIPFGLNAMIASKVISGFSSLIINSYPNKKLLNYNYINQIKDLFPNLVISVLMGLSVWCISFF